MSNGEVTVQTHTIISNLSQPSTNLVLITQRSHWRHPVPHLPGGRLKMSRSTSRRFLCARNEVRVRR